MSIGAVPQVAHAAVYNSSTGNGTINCSTSGSVLASSFKIVSSNPQGYCEGNLVIPSGITEITAHSVWNRNGNISIPASVTTIGESGFYETTASSFTVNALNSNFIVGTDGALYNSSQSRLIAYPAYRTATSFEVPASVSQIDQYSFNGDQNLTTLTFASGSLLTAIPSQSFQSMRRLQTIVFAEGLISIGAAAFSSSQMLTSVTFPSTLQTLEREVFGWMSDLTRIVIPASVTSIGEWAFWAAPYLQVVEFEGNAPASFASAFDQAVYRDPRNGPVPRAVIHSGAVGFDLNTDGDGNSGVWYGLVVTPPSTITFNSNGASVGSVPDQVTSLYGDSNTIPDKGNLVKTDYVFSGWNTLANGTGTSYLAGSRYVATQNNLDLFAQWSYDAYAVTYFGNGNSGGNVPVDSSSPRVYNTSVPVLSNTNSLVKTGYTLSSWNTAADGSGTSYSISGTDSLTMSRQAVNLYAQWQINSYTISYDANGAGGTVPTSTVGNYNSSVVVANIMRDCLCAPVVGPVVRDGYRFAGWWNTRADGTGLTYSPGDTYTIGASNQVLYAVWYQLPLTPTLSASNDGLNVTLTWPTPRAGTDMYLTGFQVQRKLGSGSWENVGVFAPRSVTASDVLTGSLNSSVSYRIAAVYDVGQTDWSSEVNLSIPTIPLAVSEVTATGDASRISIGWTAHSNSSTSGAVSFSIQATSDGLTWTTLSPSSFPTSTSAVFDAPIAGVTYRFRVKVSNSIGASSWSASSNAASLVSSSPPQAPGNTNVIINAPEVIINTPAVTIYAPTVSVGAKLSATSIATGLGVAIPSKAKTTVAIAKSSKKFCKVSGGKVVGIKSGPCVATVTVQAPKPKKGKKPAAVKKSVTVQIS